MTARTRGRGCCAGTLDAGASRRDSTPPNTTVLEAHLVGAGIRQRRLRERFAPMGSDPFERPSTSDRSSACSKGSDPGAFAGARFILLGLRPVRERPYYGIIAESSIGAGSGWTGHPTGDPGAAGRGARNAHRLSCVHAPGRGSLLVPRNRLPARLHDRTDDEGPA